jgi:hypothetical protein
MLIKWNSPMLKIILITQKPEKLVQNGNESLPEQEKKIKSLVSRPHSLPPFGVGSAWDETVRR